jgi:16S rRNA (cytosine967-C5)-methyltransferase
MVSGVTPHSRGWLRVLPGMLDQQGGLDGFFTAHLVRSA